jgi:hypothetical protein
MGLLDGSMIGLRAFNAGKIPGCGRHMTREGKSITLIVIQKE